MGKSKNTRTPPEQPHKIYLQDENLIVYFQRKDMNGRPLYLGYNMAADLWYPKLAGLDVIKRWYYSMEATRLKREGGIDERPHNYGQKAEREIGELADFATIWACRRWVSGIDWDGMIATWQGRHARRRRAA